MQRVRLSNFSLVDIETDPATLNMNCILAVPVMLLAREESETTGLE